MSIKRFKCPTYVGVHLRWRLHTHTWKLFNWKLSRNINISGIELIFYVRGVNLNNLSFIKVYGVRIPFYYTTILLERNINMVCSFIFDFCFGSYILVLHWLSHTSGFSFLLPVSTYLFGLWNASLHNFSFWCIGLKYIMSHILTVLLSKVLNYTIKN